MNIDLTNQSPSAMRTVGDFVRGAEPRVRLLDAPLLSMLHGELIENVGPANARSMMTRFGFSLGGELADAMRTGCPWSSEEEWRHAGPRLVELDGLLRFEQPGSALSRDGLEAFDSMEAREHEALFGAAASPVCWTLCGLLSGYLTRATGQELFVIEDRCAGMGHQRCHLQARTRAEWGAVHEEELRAFEWPDGSERDPKLRTPSASRH